LPASPWRALLVASAIAGGLSVALIGFALREPAWPQRGGHPEKLFLFVSMTLYLTPVLLRNPYFNRYLVPITPAWLLMVAAAAGQPALSRWSFRWGVAGVLALALFSAATTSDYLAHLELRHALVTPLLERKVNPGQIEGGMEFDGHYRYQRPGVVNLPDMSHDNVWLNERGQELLRGGPSWPHPETYVVSYCEKVPGFRSVDSATRQRLVPPVKERLHLLERTSSVSSRP
jgi:hypothetical protein